MSIAFQNSTDSSNASRTIPTNRSTRNLRIRGRLACPDLEYGYTREPTMETKQRVPIDADALRHALSGIGIVEHASDGQTVDVVSLDAKTDDLAGQYLHESQHSSRAQGHEIL
jgi:hypothetical protein